LGIIAAGTVFQALTQLSSGSILRYRPNIRFWLKALPSSQFVHQDRPYNHKSTADHLAMISTVEVIISSTGFILAYRSKGSRLQDWRVSLIIKDLAARQLADGLVGYCHYVIYMRIDQLCLGDGGK
jgi:hypothetical protein